MPVDRERLYDALRKADAAGDTEAARRLAAYIREQPSAPAQQEAAPEAEAETSPARGAVYGAAAAVPFSKQLAAGLLAAPELAGDIASGNLAGAGDRFVDRYRENRDEFERRGAVAEEEQPAAFVAGEVAGVGGALATGGVNPVSAVRGLASGARALLTREGAKGAARALLSVEGAKAAASGAAVSGAYALSDSEADLTRGEFGEAASDVAGALPAGAVLGVAARGLLGAGSARLEARTAAAAEKASTARAVGEFDAATAALPEQQAAVKAANAEAVAAAKAEGKAATKVKQAEAQEALRTETLANPLVRTGLETKLQAQYGPKVAKARGAALVNEPLPGDPSRKLVDEAEKLSPDVRFDYATGLRREQGAVLGGIRDELAAIPEAAVPVGPIRDQIRGAFSQFPPEVQAVALEKVEAMIGALAKDGALSAGALRKVIDDVDALAKFGSPGMESTLGRSQKRVFRSTYGVLVDRERQLIGTVMKNRLPEYLEANRKYGVYSDFEESANQLFRRANRGKPAVTIPKAAKVEPEVRQPLLQPDPQAPQFPGGEEALAAGRKLLEPSATAKVVEKIIRRGGTTAGAAIGATLGGGGGAVAGSSVGEALAAPAADLWLRVMTPSVASLSAKVQKLERLKPMMEEAMRKGPAEVARVHALFMQRSPDYRKAVEE